jgi:aspartokinase/homoserine dehydrogenase 1
MRSTTPERELRVFKFGSSAMAPDALRWAVALVKNAAPRLVVIASARAKAMDLLGDVLERAKHGEEKGSLAAAERYAAEQIQLIRSALPHSRAAELIASIEQERADLAAICRSVCVLKELTAKMTSAALSRAARSSAKLFAAALAQANVDAKYVDAAALIFAESRAGTAWPDFPRCESAAALLKPLLESGTIPVIPGNIASGREGEVVMLGAGGSDLSATILAKSLRASSVTLFKDCDGLMTADPKLVSNARVISELHYREAAELAYYGAPFLQPRALVPAIDSQIPVWIKNLDRPERGTRIASDVKPGGYPVKALTAFLDQALVSVEGRGMMGVPGMAARTFGALARAGHSVSMISQASSESSICFVVPGAEAGHTQGALREAFAPEIRERLIDSIQVKPDIAIVAVVGLGMRGTPGIAARTFAAFSREKINIAAIAQGSSELNITVAIEQREVSAALNALHREFQLDRMRALQEAEGRESNLVLLGFGQIGRALAEQMSEQARYFEQQLGINLKTIAVLDRSGLKLKEEGFSPASLKNLVKQKSTSREIRKPLQSTPPQSLEYLRERIWTLPLHQPVLADLTAAETAPLIMEALERSFHIVLANKKPLTVSQETFDEMMESARRHGLSFRYEATVGAGLPVLDTLSKLKEAGDEINIIEGCLSGTLGYLMSQMQDGVKFSDAVSKAHQLGYTEPDPRDDLSGLDVARKALILARTLGHKRELHAIRVRALFPETLSHPDAKEFIRGLSRLDDEYAESISRAQREGKVLRYVARISAGEIEVGVQTVTQSSPMGRLHGTDNQIVVHTRRYNSNPLVITGPGAGADVTAAGVLNDIVAIAGGYDWRSSTVRAQSRKKAVAGRR